MTEKMITEVEARQIIAVLLIQSLDELTWNPAQLGGELAQYGLDTPDNYRRLHNAAFTIRAELAQQAGDIESRLADMS